MTNYHPVNSAVRRGTKVNPGGGLRLCLSLPAARSIDGAVLSGQIPARVVFRF